MKGILAAVVVIAVTSSPAYADPKQAKKLNAKGMKLYKKKQFEKAQVAFAAAVAADPDMVIPHYNLASVAAILDDLDVVVAQLTWLKASTDPVAAKRVVKAKTDPDFRNVAAIPAFRDLVGLPTLDAMSADRILEYGGVWSGINSGCASAWDELTFGKDGKYKQRSYCGDDGQVYKMKGTWKVDGDKLHLDGAGGMTYDLEWTACGTIVGDVVDEDAMCLSDGVLELDRGPH